jgi:hypothetical protein
MKTPVLYRFVLVCLVSALPLLSSAAGNRFHLLERFGVEELTFADSTGKRSRQKPDDKKADDKKRENKKPSERPEVIKEVPRSRKLPKPIAVRDRVKIKRPPVIRPGGIKKRMGFH